MGAQIFTSRTLNDTLNPKWNFNCQFHIKDIYQDVLCITIFERDQFSPDGQFPTCFLRYNFLIFLLFVFYKCSTQEKEEIQVLLIQFIFDVSSEFLGRTEVPVATIKKEFENKGAVTRRLLLHEVPTGEVWIRLDLQLYWTPWNHLLLRILNLVVFFFFLFSSN